MADLQPYRDQTKIEVAKTGPEYGLLRPPPPPPALPMHYHDFPGFWKRLWYRITSRAIPSGSLWRCKCGCIFQLYWTSDEFLAQWKTGYAVDWINYGGYLPKEPK
jgi:hypothetical protein